MEVAGTIVGGAMAITDATSLLVKYATILQKENVEAGRLVIFPTTCEK